jgi:hypothetical protein
MWICGYFPYMGKYSVEKRDMWVLTLIDRFYLRSLESQKNELDSGELKQRSSYSTGRPRIISSELSDSGKV